jgi:integrase
VRYGGNTMASIQKYSTKKGIKWLYKVYLGIDPQTGKKKYALKRGFESKKSASLACARFEVQASQGVVKKQNNITFAETYQEWYTNYVNTVRESTWNRTAGMFKNHILPLFGNKRLATITTHEIQSAVNQWYRVATANYKRWYNYTVSVFDYGIKQEYVSHNPAKNIILPKKHDTAGDKRPNFWDKNQLIKFFNCINPKKSLDIFTMFRVLAYTGCRRGELLALEWSDIDLKKKTIRINKTLTQGKGGRQIVQAPKTKNSRRTVPIDSKTNYWLKRWKFEQRRLYLMLGFNTNQSHQLVFANTKNGYHSLNTPAKRLKKIIRDNNLNPPITIHGFRHSHISALLSAGVPVTAVQMRVGHSSPEITLSVYSHITAKQSRNAADQLEKYLES